MNLVILKLITDRVSLATEKIYWFFKGNRVCFFQIKSSYLGS